MQWAALLSWVVTAAVGFVLLTIWLRHGGMEQREGGRRIRPPLVLGHFGLAAAGLVLWIVYVLAGGAALAWIAFGTLVVVALLGWTMFAIWFQRRRTGGSEPLGAEAVAPAEHHFPVSVVALHGVLAVATVLLVFLAAVGVGT